MNEKVVEVSPGQISMIKAATRRRQITVKHTSPELLEAKSRDTSEVSALCCSAKIFWHKTLLCGILKRLEYQSRIAGVR